VRQQTECIGSCLATLQRPVLEETYLVNISTAYPVFHLPAPSPRHLAPSRLPALFLSALDIYIMPVMTIMEQVTWTIVCVLVPSSLALTTSVVVFNHQVELSCAMLILTMAVQTGVVSHALGHCHGDARTSPASPQRASLQSVTFLAAIYRRPKRLGRTPAVIDIWTLRSKTSRTGQWWGPRR
jgi:hypothetical protein